MCSIEYSRHKAKERNNNIITLEKKLRCLEIISSNQPTDTNVFQYEMTRKELQIEYDYIAEGSIVR